MTTTEMLCHDEDLSDMVTESSDQPIVGGVSIYARQRCGWQPTSHFPASSEFSTNKARGLR